MANWYGTCRSNYFTARDEDKLIQYLELFEVEYWRNDEGMFAFASNTENGGMPPVYSGYDEEDDSENYDALCDLVGIEEEDKECDELVGIIEHLGDFVADNEVAMVLEVGNEKLRYVTGRAWLCRFGEPTLFLDLEDEAQRLSQSSWGILPRDAAF